MIDTDETELIERDGPSLRARVEQLVDPLRGD
jgi:hypothetical protein